MKKLKAAKYFRKFTYPSNTLVTLDNSLFHNLTLWKPSSTIKKLLGFGLKFIPLNRPPTSASLFQAYYQFERSIRLKFMFKDKESKSYDKRFYIPNKSFLPDKASYKVEKYIYVSRKRLRKELPWTMIGAHKFNDSKVLYELKSLKNHPEIIIRPTDKNLGLCILYREDYKNMVFQHLNNTNTYQEITATEKQLMIENGLRDLQQINEFILDWDPLKVNRETLTKYLDAGMENIKIPLFHCLPKIHKKPLLGRPIAGAVSWITTNISKYLAYLLQPYVEKIPWILRDTKQLVRELSEIEYDSNMPCYIFSLDIVALYPSMIQHKIIESLDKLPAEDEIITLCKRLAKFILDYAMVEFNDTAYRQICGTPMGTNAAVQLANWYVYALVETNEFVEPGIRKKTLFYRRFLDDIFGIWTGDETQFNTWKNILNHVQEGIKFTGNLSKKSQSFLDVTLSLENGKVHCGVFEKAINLHLYLPANSNHPRAVKKGFIKGEAIRFIRNSSKEEDYLFQLYLFRKRLLNRGYSNWFITDALKNVNYADRNYYLTDNIALNHDAIENENSKVFLPLVYHRTLDSMKIGKILHQNLGLMAELPIKPVICFKKARNISQLVCSSKFSIASLEPARKRLRTD